SVLCNIVPLFRRAPPLLPEAAPRSQWFVATLLPPSRMKSPPPFVVYVAVFFFCLTADAFLVSFARFIGWGFGDGDNKIHLFIPNVVIVVFSWYKPKPMATIPSERVAHPHLRFLVCHTPREVLGSFTNGFAVSCEVTGMCCPCCQEQRSDTG